MEYQTQTPTSEFFCMYLIWTGSGINDHISMDFINFLPSFFYIYYCHEYQCFISSFRPKDAPMWIGELRKGLEESPN